jgi:hypothetical protein
MATSKQHFIIGYCLLKACIVKKIAVFKKNVSCDALKKLAAILLLALFAFNTIGFRLFIEYAMNRTDQNFEAKLDKGSYDESQLITVKLPLNLPYQSNWKDFERVNGEVNVNGTVYKYVKRKVFNDTLILQCIPHEEKTVLQQKADDYMGKVNDLPGNDNNKKADAFKQMISDYDVNTFTQTFYNTERQAQFNILHDANTLHQYRPVKEQPPEHLA